jgi:hypothetical protein
LVKDEIGDLLTNSHNILNRWKNYSFQLLNVHGVNDVWQSEIYTVKILVLDHSSFEVEIAIEKLRRYRSPGIGQIPAELIHAGGITLR